IGVSLLGRLRHVFDRLGIVLLNSRSPLVASAQIVLRLGVALFGRGFGGFKLRVLRPRHAPWQRPHQKTHRNTEHSRPKKMSCFHGAGIMFSSFHACKLQVVFPGYGWPRLVTKWRVLSSRRDIQGALF